MLKQFLIKEWKEKFPFFILAILLFVGLAALAISGKSETAGFVAVSLLMAILPLIGVMIGSSSFAAEFKNEAWAYLFSRPIRKWAVWLIKYFTQLTVLIATYIVFFLLLKLLPKAVLEIIQSYSWRKGQSDISLFSLSLLFSILAFTIAFSISILSDKQLIIFLCTALIGIGSAVLFDKYLAFLFQLSPRTRLQDTSFQAILFFLTLSFVAASILTFVKSDFSQQLKKTWLFTKFVVVFLVISIVISTAWMLGGLRSRRTDFISSIEIAGGAAFFVTEKGVFRFDPAQAKLRRIESGRSAFYIEQLSAGGDKLAVVKYRPMRMGKAKIEAPVLLVMNQDGSGKKDLLEGYLNKDSPFLNQFLWPCLISTDGARIAFATRDSNSKENTIWTINSDSSELRSWPLDLPAVSWLGFVGWQKSGKGLFISALSRWGSAEASNDLLSFDLERGGFEILAKNLRNPFGACISEDGDSMAFKFYDEGDSKEVLAKVDLRSLEKEEIYRGDSIDGFCLSEAGDKIAFIANRTKLGIYSLPDKKLEALEAIKGLRPGKQQSSSYFPSWVSHGKIAFVGDIDGQPCLRVFGEDLRQTQAITLPFSSAGAQISALGNIVLVPGLRTNTKTIELWTIDIDTEKWRKIY
jgi:ABC-type transport system involved in multi-copper enzyme maturation permease subunit